MDDMTRMQSDRVLRDAARGLVRDDVNRIRRGLQRRSIPGRVFDRTAEGAAEVLDDLADTASRHKGAIAAIVGAAVLWLARHPIMALLQGEPDDDDEDMESDND